MFFNPVGISGEIKIKNKKKFLCLFYVGFFCEVEVTFFNSAFFKFRHFFIDGL